MNGIETSTYSIIACISTGELGEEGAETLGVGGLRIHKSSWCTGS